MLENLDLHDEDTDFEPSKPEFSTENAFKDLDLGQELAENYKLAKQFLEQVRYGEDDSQEQARLMTVVSSVLKDIIKLQESVYSIERSKKIEQVLINTLKRMPENLQNDFFTQYEQAGLNAGL